MRAVLSYGDVAVGADLADALCIAVPLDFDGPQPNAFGLPAAQAHAVRDGAFVGDTRAGGSVNCESLTLAPHGNGTHTECIGHLTDERISIGEVLHGGLWLAATITIAPVDAGTTAESSEPAPRPGDRLITRAALSEALARVLEPLATPDLPLEALIVRTLPNGAGKLNQHYAADSPAPYFSAEAARWLADSSVRHLVTDLPSLDRLADEGRLTAHRIYFGLDAGSRCAGPDARRDRTVTELAFVAPMVRDGLYLLDLQIPAFLSDAAPARPLLYPATLL